MDIKYQDKPFFRVIGIEGKGPAKESINWIQALWSQAFKKKSEIAAYVNEEAWGLMSGDKYLTPWHDTGWYLAGWELKNRIEEIPDGWTTWAIPASTFATIECTRATYEKAVSLLSELVKNDVYIQTSAIHEYYPPTFLSVKEDSFSLYMAVKKRT